MTAAEIARIMEPVPREAWAWQHKFGFVGTIYIKEKSAEAAFIGSMVRWLVDHTTNIRIIAPSPPFNKDFYIDDGTLPPRMATRRPTLIEALAAACVAVGKDTQP